jgi:hypothetical protein
LHGVKGEATKLHDRIEIGGVDALCRETINTVLLDASGVKFFLGLESFD